MSLKSQDFQTLEAYKKAMRAAAGQIGNNTPFCIYSDVEIPDASKKPHPLKPFLVLGVPASSAGPMLKDLHGGKKLSCSGTCSLDGGKISFAAKSGTVNYGLFKSQATVFKELLGKEILIPAAGGAADASQKAPAADVASLDTPFGKFSYFSNEKSNGTYLHELQRAVEAIAGAQDDAKTAHNAYNEANTLSKKLPPVAEIMKQLEHADRNSSDEARQAKMVYLLFDELRSKMTDLQEDAQDAATNVDAALKLLNAEDLDTKASELKKKAEEEKSIIEHVLSAVTKTVTLGIKIATIEDGIGAVELVADIVETLGPAFGEISSAGLLQQAADCEEQAKALKKDAIGEKFAQAKNRVQAIARRQGDTMSLLNRAKDLTKTMGRAPLKGYDKAHAAKGLFNFKDLEAVANRMAEARDNSHDVVQESKLAFDISDVLLQTVPAKWKLPVPDESRKLLQKIKDEATKLGKHAGEVFKWADERVLGWQKLYAKAQEGLANANT